MGQYGLISGRMSGWYFSTRFNGIIKYSPHTASGFHHHRQPVTLLSFPYGSITLFLFAEITFRVSLVWASAHFSAGLERDVTLLFCFSHFKCANSESIIYGIKFFDGSMRVSYFFSLSRNLFSSKFYKFSSPSSSAYHQ